MKRNKKQITKADIMRAMTSLIIKTKGLDSKLNDVDILFMEFVEFLGKTDGFEKYLDKKYEKKAEQKKDKK